MNLADHNCARIADAPDIYTDFRLGSPRGKTWSLLARTGPEQRDRPNAYFALPAPATVRYVRYVHGHVGAAYLAISDLRIFGTARSDAPSAPAEAVVAREADGRNARAAWKPATGRSATTRA